MGSMVSTIGAGLVGIASIVGGHKKSKSARSAGRAIEQASKASVVTTTNTAAAPTINEVQNSEEYVHRRAKKRLSMTDTVNTFTPAGLRNTVG